MNNYREARPIFIGGLGRSGTTLLSLMLDSHRVIKCGPELHFTAPENLGIYILRTIDKLEAGEISQKLDPGIKFIRRCERLGITPEALRAAIIETDTELHNWKDRCRLIHTLCERAMEKAEKARWGIKIMNQITGIRRYQEVWPNAVFVHIIKDPRDNIAGLLKMGWGPTDIEKGAQQWVTAIMRSRRQMVENYIFLKEIRFEDLVLETEKTLKNLMDYLGEEFDPNMLRHEEMPHTFLDNRYGHPSGDQVDKPVDASYIGRYKAKLTDNEVKRIEDMTEPYFEALGYERG